ncbi:MAG: hypothetical protein Q9M20_05945 [Mariprofundaceae bacterium]|nr:hypothetical protein [Mariprofundaceae bacterium]
MKNIVWAICGLFFVGLAQASELGSSSALVQLQHEWAHINYEVPDKQKEEAFKALVAKAHAWSIKYADKPEPLVWEAIIKSTYAGAKGGFGALSLMEEARDLLLKAEKIDATILNGAIYTSLGSFYYMTPGWPIGFGDDDTALEYLNKGLRIAPNDMDANYFAGDYWFEEKEYKKAVEYFQKVIDLPDVETRPVYSKGRKVEAAVKLKKAQKRMH